jgi:signal peptidase I
MIRINPRADDKKDRTLTTVMLVASALILLLEISIFISLLPSKVSGLGEYKRQINSTLSDKDFIEELINQDSSQKQRINSLEEQLANKEIIINYLTQRLNTSLDVEISPFRKISKEDIKVYNDRVIIYVNKAFTAYFEDSKSMYPFINKDVFALEVSPENKTELKVGDIIGYESKTFNTIIIHRIVEIGEDESGWYAVTKGDNNPASDPGKARFEDIKGVLVGLIY